MTRARVGWRWVMAGTVAMIATPAAADVKAGVDAWNKGDYARAVAEWRAPAVAGDPDAEYNLGQAYKLGRGVPADLTQAESWYQKAAAQGHTMAQDNYGLALFQGGRKADALPWLEKSAARDEKRTELVLGTMLFNGDAVPKDWVRAYALVSRSSQQGLPQASQTLAQMDGFLSSEQRQQGVALAGRIADEARSAQVAALGNPANPSATRRRREAPLAAQPGPARPSAHPIAPIDVPPSAVPERRTPRQQPEVQPASLRHGGLSAPSRGESRPTTPASASAPHPAPAQVSRPIHAAPAGAAAVATTGRWKVQLGAFRDEGNARALWSKLSARVGGHPIYAKAGAVTRLQAGSFATKAEAERACRAAGSSCVVIP